MTSLKEELYRNLLIKKKEKGLKDLYFFNKYILEADPNRQKFLVDHVHGEWTNWYEKSTKRIKMILVPRACFKSTFFTVGRTIQAICQNRNERILIANATLGNAQKFVGEIKEHLRRNELLRKLYGEFYDKNLRWNEDEFDVMGRGLGIPQATVTAVGVGGNLVSQHYSKIIADDLMNEENSSSRYQTEKVIDWWKRAFSLLDYDGEMIIIGTRWSNYDLYAYIASKLSDQTDIYIRGARNPDKTLYFPELLSEEKLKELRGLQGSYIFSCFYLNDPIDDESAIIKRSQLKYYGEGESNQLPQNLNMFSVCDPAVSQSESADESSIITVGVDTNNNWWILETRSGQWTTFELIEQLFSVHAQWKPINMTLEVIGQAQGIMLPIHDEEDRRKIYLPLMEITSRGQIKKEIRIRSVLQPRFERGKVFIKRDMVDLEDQLVRFPHCNRDDMIDALTDVEDIAYSADSPESPYKESGSKLQDILNKQKLNLGDYIDPFMGSEF
jgi:phage terminase large subunit-like protein/glycosyltransferase involved in cell wall biosynthesis